MSGMGLPLSQVITRWVLDTLLSLLASVYPPVDWVYEFKALSLVTGLQ